jgi:hypothetical protein
MKTIHPPSSRLILLCLALLLAGCGTPPPPPPAPAVTPDGLAKVEDAKADLVYRLPGARFDGYTKVALLEPRIAFRKNWQNEINANRDMDQRPVSDHDMQTILDNGRRLLIEEFSRVLTKGGYTVVTDLGPDVLAIRGSILDLDVFAPDPNNMQKTWSQIYTNGSGSATLCVELYDSVTAQLLARAFDQKTNANDDAYTWNTPRNRATNLADGRSALADWAEMLVEGLNRAKTAKKP